MNKKLDTEAAAIAPAAYDEWWNNYSRVVEMMVPRNSNLRQEAFQAGVRAGLAARDQTARHKAD